MAALSQGDIMVFGTPWGTLLDPPGLHKYIWQKDLASLPLAASTFTRQMALTSSDAASQPQNSTRQYFFAKSVKLVSLLLYFSTLCLKESIVVSSNSLLQ